ncbi:hypothetical protein OS493_037343 [Desmophyllum pertusum]|uniref:Fibrinogen C-terminal domain-containing protein n=1 Tax=Desmophyllum pertusum TaxID=174260 RepID=A0A9X0CNB9_9CNID|nr:hypothetical protein OS493_037343 [Desmophyllum pertusum]
MKFVFILAVLAYVLDNTSEAHAIAVADDQSQDKPDLRLLTVGCKGDSCPKAENQVQDTFRQPPALIICCEVTRHVVSTGFTTILVANTYTLHIDSSHSGCQFDPRSCAVSSEDNFGYYGSINPKFRCAEGPHSTTQWWFGAHFQHKNSTVFMQDSRSRDQLTKEDFLKTLVMMVKSIAVFLGLLAFSIAEDQSSAAGNGNSGGCKGDSCPSPKDKDTFHPYSCLDYLEKGASKCGIYKLFDTAGNSYPAYCDMKSEPGTAWTLVMSWSNSHQMLPSFRSTPFKYNAPVNENSQNWNLYRLSLVRMTSLQSHSTHWRATCSYPTHGVDFKDYVRGNFKEFNIVDFLGHGKCFKVEYINIREHTGIHLTAPFWQAANSYFLHTNSPATSCQFKANSGAVSSEDNFGFHGNSNPKFPLHRGESFYNPVVVWWSSLRRSLIGLHWPPHRTR